MLAKQLAQHWWVVLIRGIVAVAFGVTAYAWPGLTLGTFILFFAAFAFADGVLDIVNAVGGRKENEHWWWQLLGGGVGILFGVLTLQNPLVTTVVLLLYMAAWAVATGVVRIVLAVRLRKEIEGELWMGLSGLASVFFGLLMMARPAVGALALVWLVAVWSIAIGACLIVLAFRLRSFRPKETGAPLGGPLTAHG
jgi:uncharacterized membrane protein HdeD (DUF308 family)